MEPVARNFAQLALLAYCLWLLYRSHRILRTMLLIRMKERDLERRTRGLVNNACFLKVKRALPPLLYWLNLAAVAAFAFDLVFQLVFGWFGFSGILTKIFNSAAAIFCGAIAYLTALMDSLMRHDKLFIWYNWDPDGDKLFSSGVLDILLFAVGPIAIVVSNFLAL